MRDALRTPLGKLMMALVAVVVAIIVFVGLGWFTLRSGVDKMVDYGRRADCRSEINAAFSPILQDKQDADSLAFRTLITVVLQHSPAGTPLTADENQQISEAYRLAGLAADAADDLPTVPQAVEHGYTLDGMHHRACPKVG